MANMPINFLWKLKAKIHHFQGAFHTKIGNIAHTKTHISFIPKQGFWFCRIQSPAFCKQRPLGATVSWCLGIKLKASHFTPLNYLSPQLQHLYFFRLAYIILKQTSENKPLSYIQVPMTLASEQIGFLRTIEWARNKGESTDFQEASATTYQNTDSWASPKT